MERTIRLAREADADAIADIYAPHVRDGVTSFELAPPTPSEMRGRMADYGRKYPWLVCEGSQGVIGYAYACEHRTRAAYRWSVDVTVYIHADHRRQGIGRALYTALFPILKLQGFINAYAGITVPNAGSVGLHESMGFRLVGIYYGEGYKMGAWRDVGWWHRPLAMQLPNPVEPTPITQISPADLDRCINGK